MPIQTNVPLAGHTTFGLPSIARRYVAARSAAALAHAVREARASGEPYWLLAGGSNVVTAERVERLVIHYLPTPGEALVSGTTVEALGSLPLADLVTSSIHHSLAGLEALSGIPGTVGGAVAGNAGAYGQAISDKLVRVEVFDPVTGETKWLSGGECGFAYRESIFKHQELIILRAVFELESGDREALAKKSHEIIATRESKYSPGLKCPGSFFKNILVSDVAEKSLSLIDQARIREGKIPAGYLLEEVGAKGMRRGGIYVASFHGNLLVNDGGGTYSEVVELAMELKKLVQERFGIKLEEEVRYFT